MLALGILGGCGTQAPTGGSDGGAAGSEPPAGVVATPQWSLETSGGDMALSFVPASGPAAVRLICPAGQDRLLINVRDFRPIGSEERMSFGSRGEVVALVADSRGDAQRGGVTGAGPTPDFLKQLADGGLTISYGAQRSGPHPAVPEAMVRKFVTACAANQGAARQAAAEPTDSTSPCLVQDGDLLRASPLRVIGTEPFWGARIQGRCITYSTPEDQKGTRIWTRLSSGPDGGIWSGAFNDKPFILYVRPQPDCSDGMSDKRYDWRVDLTVDGEKRQGCAEPL